jgi:hypothetical protein
LKITAAKLLANKANAQKSSGPKSQEGKQTSAKNSQKYAFTAFTTDLPEAFTNYIDELNDLGYEKERACQIINELYRNRLILNYKIDNYIDRYNDEHRLPNFQPANLMRILLEFGEPSRASRKDTLPIFHIMYRIVLKDNDLVGLLFEKNQRHSRVIRYEQNAINRVTKATKLKK